jgi:hypothetical protein
VTADLPPTGDAAWVGRAVAAVSAFHPQPGQVETLLTAWKYRDRLTTGQVRQVAETVRRAL